MPLEDTISTYVIHILAFNVIVKAACLKKDRKSDRTEKVKILETSVQTLEFRIHGGDLRPWRCPPRILRRPAESPQTKAASSFERPHQRLAGRHDPPHLLIPAPQGRRQDQHPLQALAVHLDHHRPPRLPTLPSQALAVPHRERHVPVRLATGEEAPHHLQRG